MSSRSFLASLLLLATVPLCLAAPNMQTYTFKKAGNLEIKADVTRKQDKAERPVVVLIHGGALIMGGRQGAQSPFRELINDVVDAGYVMVSIDYRLAPEAKLPVIIEDVEDAFRWVRTEGPKLFQADPNRVAAWGASAGGYLALSAGQRVQPPLKAVVSIFGYGDLIGDWYSKPSTNARHNQKPITEEQARALVAGPVVSNDRERKSSAADFYHFSRQRGIWPREVSSWDPLTEASKFFPYMPLKNVSRNFPPTLLVHGTADTDVPYTQSVLMAGELQKHGVEHRLITIASGEHGFGGGDPKEIDAAYGAALSFLHKHLKH